MTVLEMVAALGLEVNEKEWKSAEQLVKSMIAEFRKLATEAMFAKTDVKKAMDVIGLPAVDAKKKLDGVAKAGQGVAHMFKWMAAAAAGYFAASSLKDSIAEVAEYGGKLNDLAQATGTPAETLQTLGYAAAQNSSSLDSVAAALVKIGQNAKHAAEGGKEQAKAFSAMGISVTDAEGKIRPAADLFRDVSDRMASLEDGTQKTNEAVGVLGKTGYELIPMLNGGSAGLDAMAAKAIELGGVLDDTTVAALDEFGDTTDDIKYALGGLKQTVVAEMLPALKELADDVLGWVKANRKVIAQRLTTIFRGLVAVLKVVGKVIDLVVAGLAIFVDHLDLVAVALIALGITMIAFKAASIATALATAWAWTVAALPFVLIAILIGAVILIIEDLYRAFTGGKSVFKDFYEAVKEWVGEKVMGVINGVIGGINKVIGAFEKLSNAAASFVEDHDWLVSLAGGAAAGGASMIKNERERRRKAGLSADVDVGRIDELKAGDWSGDSASEYDNAVTNYGSPEATAQREANMRARAAATPTFNNPGGMMSTSSVMENNITIQVPPGANADEIGASAVQAIKGFFDGEIRRAKVGTGTK